MCWPAPKSWLCPRQGNWVHWGQAISTSWWQSTQMQALRVAEAIRDGRIEVVRSTGCRSRQELMMNEIEVALAVSARMWPDRLHRFLADHGGARVRAQVLAPEDALAETYEVLIIDDVSSFLTPRLVQELQRTPADGPRGVRPGRRSGRQGTSSRVRRRSGNRVGGQRRRVRCRGSGAGRSRSERTSCRAGRVVGAGYRRAADRRWGSSGRMRSDRGGDLRSLLGSAGPGPTVLVDVDEVAPSVAQRLGLRLLPNLRTAIDVVQHRSGDLGPSLAGGMAGSASCAGSPVRAIGLRSGLSSSTTSSVELRRRFRFVVANVGPLPGGGRVR